jgi:glucokinase
MILVGDVGGTKTDLALYTDNGQRTGRDTLRSRDYDNLEDLVRVFLQQHQAEVKTAVFGVAGPVTNGHAETTNLPWTIAESRLAKELDIASVKLLNDLEAMAYAVTHLAPEDVRTINPDARSKPQGPVGVLAPGTGLGQAYLLWQDDAYVALPSEGGHNSFAPSNAQQIRLLAYLMEHHRHVSVERVCSGIGLPNLYNFLKDSGDEAEPEWLRVQLEGVTDPVPTIIRAALNEDTPECAICRATLTLFIDIMAAEASNLALKLVTTGGIYLGGGLPRHIDKALTYDAFMPSFLNKGRMAKLLRQIPVQIIQHPEPALLGAVHYAMTR